MDDSSLGPTYPERHWWWEFASLRELDYYLEDQYGSAFRRLPRGEDGDE